MISNRQEKSHRILWFMKMNNCLNAWILGFFTAASCCKPFDSFAWLNPIRTELGMQQWYRQQIVHRLAFYSLYREMERGIVIRTLVLLLFFLAKMYSLALQFLNIIHLLVMINICVRGLISKQFTIYSMSCLIWLKNK